MRFAFFANFEFPCDLQSQIYKGIIANKKISQVAPRRFRKFYFMGKTMARVKILHEPNQFEPFLVLEKPSGIPSAPLFEGDTRNALFEAATLFPQIKSVHGKKRVEAGLLHRIDTQTRGLLLLAASQEFYDHMILSQERGRFVKTYFAECACDKENAEKLGGFPCVPPEACDTTNSCQSQTVSSYFRFYGEGRREVRPVIEGGSKFAIKKLGAKSIYSTQIEFSFCDKKSAKIKCRIEKGFRHQVRCHLAWLGFPVIGDAIYNYEFRSHKNEMEMRFFAAGLEFPDLRSEKVFRFEMDVMER